MRMHTKLCWDFRSPPPVKSNPPSIGNKRLKLRWLFWCLFPSIQGSISPWLILILLTLSSKHILSPPERYWLNPLPEKKKKKKILQDHSTCYQRGQGIQPKGIWTIWTIMVYLSCTRGVSPFLPLLEAPFLWSNQSMFPLWSGGCGCGRKGLAASNLLCIREEQECCFQRQPTRRWAQPIVKPQRKSPFLHSEPGQPKAQNPKPLLMIYYVWELKHVQSVCIWSRQHVRH